VSTGPIPETFSKLKLLSTLSLTKNLLTGANNPVTLYAHMFVTFLSQLLTLNWSFHDG
jgi:hypothetical protein